MGNIPPIGYDDSTFIPKERLNKVITKIDERLQAIQKLSRENIPQSIQEELDKEFHVLDETADELHLRSHEVVQKVFNQYQKFRLDPNTNLSRLREDMKNLKLYLQG